MTAHYDDPSYKPGGTLTVMVEHNTPNLVLNAAATSTGWKFQKHVSTSEEKRMEW